MVQMKGSTSLVCFCLWRLDQVCLNKKWQELKPADEILKGLLSNSIQTSGDPSHVIFAGLWAPQHKYHNMFSGRNLYKAKRCYILHVRTCFSFIYLRCTISSLQLHNTVVTETLTVAQLAAKLHPFIEPEWTLPCSHKTNPMDLIAIKMN